MAAVTGVNIHADKTGSPRFEEMTSSVGLSPTVVICLLYVAIKVCFIPTVDAMFNYLITTDIFYHHNS